ncbi:HAD-IA family hydrolase [Streptomyces sp. NBC_00582]|uniref:HAD-IA family hydrolase n=1 Tax=Streptomyces sp. NBC_00582 TaxID=2975783 RepID=UPI002E81CCEA|nr:HAD-IA family hydrolase [Streptomyces sp. NBC_00582]WUB67459.1 HAD-IA family hydrolase [Streptomyces sp. NBC_00582]
MASTSAQHSVEAVLRSVVGADIRARMSGVYAGDIVPAKKPAPDIYLLALRELGRSAEEAIVVEDSESGALAAARAGVPHLVTISHFTADDPFPDARAVLSDLGEPTAPTCFLAGKDVRNNHGVVDLRSLHRIRAQDQSTGAGERSRRRPACRPTGRARVGRFGCSSR